MIPIPVVTYLNPHVIIRSFHRFYLISVSCLWYSKVGAKLDVGLILGDGIIQVQTKKGLTKFSDWQIKKWNRRNGGGWFTLLNHKTSLGIQVEWLLQKTKVFHEVRISYTHVGFLHKQYVLHLTNLSTSDQNQFSLTNLFVPFWCVSTTPLNRFVC